MANFSHLVLRVFNGLLIVGVVALPGVKIGAWARRRPSMAAHRAGAA
ncbi:MAG: hypothetical protein H6645_10845 [Caldilineaceae bacterium]|nr:hypothetical protein [Caldilineaceae bacterium]